MGPATTKHQISLNPLPSKREQLSFEEQFSHRGAQGLQPGDGVGQFGGADFVGAVELFVAQVQGLSLEQCAQSCTTASLPRSQIHGWWHHKTLGFAVKK